MTKKVFFLVGEASADLYASKLIESWRAQMPDLQVYGTGGEKMAKAGLKPLFHAKDLGVLGLSEVLPKIGFFLQVMRKVKAFILEQQIDLVVLVDYPGFNLRLAEFLKQKSSIPVVYYIPPAVWAWKEHRVSSLRQNCALLIGIYNFEQEFYRKHAVEFHYFGHPLAFSLASYPKNKAAFYAKLAINPEQDPAHKVVALLPGSRGSAFFRIFPLLLEVSRRFLSQKKPISFVWCVPKSLPNKAFQLLEPFQNHPSYRVAVEDTSYVLAHSDFACCAGSTASFEAALLFCPFLTLYSLNPLSFWWLRRHYKRDYYGLPNIFLGEKAFPEAMQKEMTVENVARLIEQGLYDPASQADYQRNFERLKTATLSFEDPYQKTADFLTKRFF